MKPNSILIVDDNKTSNFVTKLLIQKLDSNISIETKLNGREAIEFLSNTSSWPSIILLDINMPLINGFEFLDWYDDNHNKGKTKIIMLSTSIRSEDMERCMRHDDVIHYVDKPVTKEKLEKLFRE